MRRKCINYKLSPSVLKASRFAWQVEIMNTMPDLQKRRFQFIGASVVLGVVSGSVIATLLTNIIAVVVGVIVCASIAVFLCWRCVHYASTACG
jgi:Flp pilus assembly protein TadB